MKTALLTFLIIFLFILSGCIASMPLYEPYSSLDYREKYASYLEADEKEIYSWYYYVITRNQKGKYIKRTFFPETGIITSKVTCNDPSGLVANGKATTWWDNGNIKSSGSYKQNKKEGNWNHYNLDGNLNEVGSYSYNKRKGVWAKFDKKGHVVEKVYYKNGIKNGAFSQFDTLGNVVNEGIYKNDVITQQTSLEKMERIEPYSASCEFIPDLDEKLDCSKKKLLAYFLKNMKYPERAIRYKVEGMTLTSFYVDKDGSITDIEVLVGVNDDIKKECIRLIKNIPKLVAGRINGENEKMQMFVPLNFNAPISYYD